MARVLIVDDEKNIRLTLRHALQLEGYDTDEADGVEAARRAVEGEPDLVLLDVKMPDGSGLDLLRDLARSPDAPPIVMMSGHANIEMALDATRAGAHDFLEKPIATEKLLLTVRNTLQYRALSRQVAEQRAKEQARFRFVGDSPVMQALYVRIEKAAPTSGRCLITGENGTGKEMVARALHELSKRAGAPFVKLNCAAVPKDLIESELFGHEKGSFTGALQRRRGKFEQAHGGTLFLDEIGDMPLDMQAKLLRVLQEGEVERVGGSAPFRVDVRVIAATNQDLGRAIGEGRFREDLFYRLNVVPIEVPPLRERLADLAALVAHFVAELGGEAGPVPVLTPAALRLLEQHRWPGNVRELRNCVERMVILGDPARGTIDEAAVRALIPALAGSTAGSGLGYRPGVPLRDLVVEAERWFITKALAAHDNHITNTALDLQLERSHLYKKMRALGMEPAEKPAARPRRPDREGV